MSTGEASNTGRGGNPTGTSGELPGSGGRSGGGPTRGAGGGGMRGGGRSGGGSTRGAGGGGGGGSGGLDPTSELGAVLRAFLLSLLGAGGAGAVRRGDSAEASAEASRELGREREVGRKEFHEDVLVGNHVEDIPEFLPPNFRDYFQPPGHGPGLEGIRRRFESWAEAFETQRIEDWIPPFTMGDYHVHVNKIYMRHIGDWMGVPATNEDVVMGGIDVFRYEGDAPVAHWGLYDWPGLADQVGARVIVVPKGQGELAPEKVQL